MNIMETLLKNNQPTWNGIQNLCFIYYFFKKLQNKIENFSFSNTCTVERIRKNTIL